MHQITIDDDIFSKLQNVSNSLNITVSDFIRQAITNELQKDHQEDMNTFFENMQPLKSFDNIDTTEYVDNLRANSRIINE